MTAQWWMAIAAGVMIASSVVLAKFDEALRAKGDRDRVRHENDAIDLTGGTR